MGIDEKKEKVSLILTTYNCEKTLPFTLESILQQDYQNIEVIIKDGGSTDQTLKIIQEYKKNKKININFKSCSDKGIYDAMNQGFKMSTGEYIAFFNDIFVKENAVTKLVQAIGPENVGSHSDLIYCTEDKTIRYWKMGNSENIYEGWLPAHPTLLLRRSIYQKYGLYRTDLKCSADYEFMVRILKDGKNTLGYVPEILISMFYGGTSNAGLSNYWVSLKEGNIALKENNVKKAWLISLKRTWKVLKQFITATQLERD